MVEVILNTKLHQFATCKEFAEEFKLGEGDLVLTNEYIYNPYFGEMDLKVHTIFQEKYGMGEPTDVMVEAIMQEAAKTGCKRIVAIGGGTVIDIAKVLAVAGEESIDALYDMAPNLPKRRELIILPTTCGTGSEVTNIAILNRTRMGTKMGLVGPAMYADSAALIPELLEGLPFGVFATSSIDALVHAVESSLSPKATPYTKLFGYKAIEMIDPGLSEDRGGRQRRPYPASGGLPHCIQLRRYRLWYGGLCGCPRDFLSPGRKVSCAPRREQLCHVYRRAEKLHGEIRQDGEIAVMNRYLADLLGCEVERVYDALEELRQQYPAQEASAGVRRHSGGPERIHRQRYEDPGPPDGEQLCASGP